MAKNKSGYKMDGVIYRTMKQVSKVIGITEACLFEKVRQLGRSEFTSEEIRSMLVKKNERWVDIEGRGLFRVGELPKIFPELNRSPGYFRNQWMKHGQPEKMKYSDFTVGNENISRTAAALLDTSKYSDPNYLPETPWGDLAGLSDKENTGAALRDCINHMAGSGALKSISGMNLRLGL